MKSSPVLELQGRSDGFSVSGAAILTFVLPFCFRRYPGPVLELLPQLGLQELASRSVWQFRREEDWQFAIWRTCPDEFLSRLLLSSD
jgi:hypothetical protein